MKTVKTNTWGLEVGDVITFTNSVNYPVELVVSRVENKSWYVGGGRNSYGTLAGYEKRYADFKITKKQIIL